MPYEVVVADDGGEVFSRGCSLNQVFETTDADVAICCDADLLVPLANLTTAVQMAADEPGLVQPFDEVVYMNKRGKKWFQCPVTPQTPLLGGCNVLSRGTWEKAGGWDPGFRGWCAEDIDFANRCSTVAPLRRLAGRATHLYHPKTGDYASKETIAANGERLRRNNEQRITACT